MTPVLVQWRREGKDETAGRRGRGGRAHSSERRMVFVIVAVLCFSWMCSEVNSATTVSAERSQALAAPVPVKPERAPPITVGVVNVDCPENQVICPDDRCVPSVEDCNSRLDFGSFGVDTLDVNITSRDQKVTINLSANKQIIGSVVCPPGNFNDGWLVSVRTVSDEKQEKLRKKQERKRNKGGGGDDDDDDDDDDREDKTAKNIPFELIVRNASGKKIPIKDLPRALVLRSFVELKGVSPKDLKNVCFGYSGDGDDDWKCLPDTKFKKTKKKDIYLFTATTDHLTSFGVFFSFSSGGGRGGGGGEGGDGKCCGKGSSGTPKAYWIAAVVLIGSAFLCIVFTLFAERNVPYLSELVRGYDKSKSIKSIQQGVERRMTRLTQSTAAIPKPVVTV